MKDYRVIVVLANDKIEFFYKIDAIISSKIVIRSATGLLSASVL